MTQLRRSSFIIHILISTIVLRIATIFKVSYIIGSKMSFFSVTDLVGPVIGSYGLPVTLCVFLLRSCMSYNSIFTVMLSHLPTLCGSLYWATHSIVIRLILPLVCIALFLVHPTGMQAYVYSFYWFIPVGVYMLGFQGVWAQAFASTFIIHAVGSVLWLYTVPMDATIWWGLIPVVALERLVSATGMVVAYKAIHMLKVYTQKAWITKAA